MLRESRCGCVGAGALGFEHEGSVPPVRDVVGDFRPSGFSGDGQRDLRWLWRGWGERTAFHPDAIQEAERLIPS